MKKIRLANKPETELLIGTACQSKTVVTPEPGILEQVFYLCLKIHIHHLK